MAEYEMTINESFIPTLIELAQNRTCPECHRMFDLRDEADADEWYYGHDCEDN